MFGSALPKDEFRSLLKEKLGYSDSTGEVVDSDQVLSVARLLGTSVGTVKKWVQGRARPTPPEELRAVTVLRALKTFEKA